MRAIPNRLAVLDGDRKRVGYLARVPSTAISEADCDRLIVENLDLVAETLRNAGILPESSDLLLLGTQVRCIDVLCAERDLGTDELRRLVLIESKLFRNPQARREVVAQLLDYASDLDLVGPQEMIEALDADAQQWLEDQVPQLKRLLATSDYLLLIAGDDVQPRAAQLVARMARDRAPLSHTDVVMLGLSLFRDGDRMLLVPNVVGGVVGAQRELRVHVEVSTGDLPVTIERVHIADTAQGALGKGHRTPDDREFFESGAWHGHSEDADRLKRFFASLAAAGIRGLQVSAMESGRPVVHLLATRVGRLKVLAAMSARRGIWDSLVAWHRQQVDADAPTAAAVATFRDKMIQLGFTQHDSQRTEGTVDVVDRCSAQIIDALRSLTDATHA